VKPRLHSHPPPKDFELAFLGIVVALAGSAKSAKIIAEIVTFFKRLRVPGTLFIDFP
jgi:hypothetical protein